MPGNVSPETKGWIGERFDADAGLQYLNARYYDPALSLFLQPDWFEVTKPGVGTNRFSYSFNDPVNKIDPGGNEGYEYDIDDFCRELKDEAETVLPGVGKELVNDAIIAGDIGIGFVPVAGGLYGAYMAETWGGVAVSLGSEFLGPAFDVARVGYRVGKAALGVEKAVDATQEVASISKRVDEIHALLDTQAARHRTTGILETTYGTRIVAGGVRDLSPAQRAALADGEIAAKQPGAHAEITALGEAAKLGLSPSALATSWNICPDCADAIRNLGGVLVDARSAFWK